MGAAKNIPLGSAWDVSNWGTKPTPMPEAAGFIENNPAGYSGFNRFLVMPFDGEKDLGEMGPVKKYIVDYTSLRYRSWQLFLESDVCHALFQRSAIWGVGTGLKLQSEPVKEVLKYAKISFDREDFNKEVEALFKVYSNSNISDYCGQRNLHELASEAWMNIEVGGDVLMVLRYMNGIPKVELIDGNRVKTPYEYGFGQNSDTVNPNTKNIIRHGIEMDATGRHVAYWVETYQLGMNVGKFERIPVRMDKYPYSETARLIYGLRYRIDNARGIPRITAVMETAAKMGRYREAVLGSAEERSKIAYSIEHEKESTGEHPAVQQLSRAFSASWGTDLPVDSYGQQLANVVQASTNKQTFNMPIGSKMVALESKQELSFKEFYETNFDLVCAVAGYPPEVIMSKFNANYSASRAAIKDFEHTLLVRRKEFSRQFYQVIYNFCLDAWCLTGVLSETGYVRALAERNEVILEAYRNARWQGDNVPHIDPEKEVKAWRLKLGNDKIPLTTVEEATEELSGNDAIANMEQFAEEMKKMKELGIDTEEEKPEKGGANKEDDKERENETETDE